MPVQYSKQQLLNLFNKRLKIQLKNMETQRIRLRNQTIILGFLFAIIFTCSKLPTDFYQRMNFIKMNIPVVIVIIIILGIYFGYNFYKDNKSYRSRYKKHILRKVFEIVLPGSSYSPSGHLLRSDYDSSRIFISGYNRFHGEDLISANYNGLPFQFSELQTKHVSGSGKKRREKTIFRGIFFKAELPLKVHSNLVIIPDVLNKILGNLISGFLEDLNFKRDKIVKLESLDFEKVFAIYGSNQIEARKILTPIIMEKILKYNSKTKKDISISIQNGTLYMAIPFDKNLFEPRIWSPTSYNDIVQICKVIEILTEIFDHFEHIREEVA